MPSRESTTYTKKCKKCGAYTRSLTGSHVTCGKCYLKWKREQREAIRNAKRENK
tara:strand:- start:90 stop:251 length:162 start_codon:yes stop_codon:yes gene_type:complete